MNDNTHDQLRVFSSCSISGDSVAVTGADSLHGAVVNGRSARPSCRLANCSHSMAPAPYLDFPWSELLEFIQKQYHSDQEELNLHTSFCTAGKYMSMMFQPFRFSKALLLCPVLQNYRSSILTISTAAKIDQNVKRLPIPASTRTNLSDQMPISSMFQAIGIGKL